MNHAEVAPGNTWREIAWGHHYHDELLHVCNHDGTAHDGTQRDMPLWQLGMPKLEALACSDMT